MARNPTFQNSLDDLPFLPKGYGELVTEKNQTDRRCPVVKRKDGMEGKHRRLRRSRAAFPAARAATSCRPRFPHLPDLQALWHR
jgi:hypothetical protein